MRLVLPLVGRQTAVFSYSLLSELDLIIMHGHLQPMSAKFSCQLFLWYYYSLHCLWVWISCQFLMVLKGAIWLSAAVISATLHHCIHLVVVQPPGVKVGWCGHASLQHHILTSLTQAYVGYTVKFQQSPSLLYSWSICQSPSLHLPPSHPDAYEPLLTYGLWFRLAAWVDTVSLHLCHFPQARKVYS